MVKGAADPARRALVIDILMQPRTVAPLFFS